MTNGTIAILTVILAVVSIILGVVWWATRTDRRRTDELHRRIAAAPPESLDRDGEDEWPGRQRGTDVYHGATPMEEFTGDYPDGSERQRWTDTGGPADRLPPRLVRDPRRFDEPRLSGRRSTPYRERGDDGDPNDPPVVEMTPPTMTPLAMTPEPVRYSDDPPRSYDPAADTHVVDPSTWSRPGLQPGEPVTGVPELDRTYGSSPSPSPSPDPSPPPASDHGGYSGGSSGGSDYGGSNYGS